MEHKKYVFDHSYLKKGLVGIGTLNLRINHNLTGCWKQHKTYYKNATQEVIPMIRLAMVTNINYMSILRLQQFFSFCFIHLFFINEIL